MKKFIFYLLTLVGFTASAQVYEFKVVTAIESVVPSGAGRSRLISANETRNYKEFTTTRSEEGDERNKRALMRPNSSTSLISGGFVFRTSLPTMLLSLLS